MLVFDQMHIDPIILLGDWRACVAATPGTFCISAATTLPFLFHSATLTSCLTRHCQALEILYFLYNQFVYLAIWPELSIFPWSLVIQLALQTPSNPEFWIEPYIHWNLPLPKIISTFHSNFPSFQGWIVWPITWPILFPQIITIPF